MAGINDFQPSVADIGGIDTQQNRQVFDILDVRVGNSINVRCESACQQLALDENEYASRALCLPLPASL